MTRVKRGVAAHKRRKYVLKRTKGFTNRRRTNAIAAKEALLHADSYAYAHRRLRKRDFKKLWTIRTNAAAREQEVVGVVETRPYAIPLLASPLQGSNAKSFYCPVGGVAGAAAGRPAFRD